MSNLKDIMFDTFMPSMAIIVYHARINSRYYLERRKIDSNGNMHNGVPLTYECLSDMVSTFSASEKDIIHGRIPDNMLMADCRIGKEKYVWFYPATKKMLYFSSKLQIENGSMWLPGLVFMVNNKTLSVFAYKTKKITPETPLFKPPFFNIGNNCNVCLGNAKVQKPDKLTYETLIAHWEKKFFQSEFSHLNESNPVKGNLSNLIKDSIRTDCRFPCNELNYKMNIKLKDILE